YQLQRRHGGKGFGTGEQFDQRVLLPDFLAGVIGHTSPEVNDGFATQLNAYCRPALRRLFEQLTERIPNCFETKIEIPLNVQSGLLRRYSMWRLNGGNALRIALP